MKILTVLFALIAGLILASIQVRHAGSISKAIFSNHKWLDHKIDNVDKVLIAIAAGFFVAFLVTITLTV
jgi:hypothetical protein